MLFVLNREADPVYARGRWLYPETPYLVLHRPCVSPAFQSRGIGAQAVRQAERISKEAGAGAIRLDAFSQNPFALRLYERLGYRRVGQAMLRMGLFYLYEKKLGRD